MREAAPSRNFSWLEMDRHDSRDPLQAAALRALAVEVLQPLRDHLRRPVTVTSGLRSEARNREVGGSRKSQHLTGEAVDIRVDGMSSRELAAAIVALGLPVDQVIWYDHSRHVHVSRRRLGEQRGHVLRAVPPLPGAEVARVTYRRELP